MKDELTGIPWIIEYKSSYDGETLHQHEHYEHLQHIAIATDVEEFVL